MKILKNQPPQNRRILIAEDDADFLETLQASVLAFSSTLEVSTAKNGSEALDMVLNQRYDLLISDLRMPGIDGNSLIHSIQHLKEGLRPKMILVISGLITAIAEEENKSKNMIVYYLPKPIERKTLFEYLSKCLGPSSSSKPLGS